MGLFTGGGFLGDIGGSLGINTSKQEKALDKATRAQTASIAEAISGLEGARDLGLGEVRGATEGAVGRLSPIAGLVGETLPGLQRGSTAEGFGSNIAEILRGGALNPLIAERQKQSGAALASAGLSRSNVAAERAAEIPTELAFNLENQLRGRQQGLFDAGLGATGDIGNIQRGDAANIVNLLRGTAQDVGNLGTQAGAAQSQNILGQQQIKQTRNQNIAGLAGNLFGGGGFGGGGLDAAGASGAGGGGGLGGLGGIGALAGLLQFSDDRLKTNEKIVGRIGPLNVYTWDWIPEMGGSVDDQPTRGFLAHQVERLFPDKIVEIAGFKAIKMGELLEQLEEAA